MIGRTLTTWQMDSITLSEATYEPGAMLAAHEHARSYLCLVLEGGHRETSGMRVSECKPSSVVVHPAGERHSNRFGPDGCRLFRVEIEEELLRDCDGFAAPMECHGGPLSALALRMFREWQARDELSSMMIESLALQFAVGAARNRVRQDRAAPPWLSRVRDYVHAHFAREIRLEELAREAGVHPAHLNRAFRAHNGCSIGEYMRRLRVDNAASLLASSSDSLADIATATGFADQSHFNRVFVRMMGVTPARFRKERRPGARRSSTP